MCIGSGGDHVEDRQRFSQSSVELDRETLELLAARVAAAADVVFADIDSEMPGVEGERFAELKDEARSLLGDEEYARIRAEIEAGTVEEALLEAAR